MPPSATKTRTTSPEVVEDESADTPYEHLEEKTLTRMLQGNGQDARSSRSYILRARFGLDGGSQKTLEEVGQKFGVTRERVPPDSEYRPAQTPEDDRKMEMTKG